MKNVVEELICMRILFCSYSAFSRKYYKVNNIFDNDTNDNNKKKTFH